MLALSDDSVRVKSVTIKDQAGPGSCKARISVYAEPAIEELPELQAEVRALLAAQERRKESDAEATKDTIKLSLRRTLPMCTYRITEHPDGRVDAELAEVIAINPKRKGARGVITRQPLGEVEFSGESVSPVIVCEHGTLSVRWSVDAIITHADLAKLGRMVGCEFLTVTVNGAQMDLLTLADDDDEDQATG